MIKLCCTCVNFNSDNNGCRRKIKPVGIELVYGTVVYATTTELNAYRERAAWFGCGKEGIHWRSKPVNVA